MSRMQPDPLLGTRIREYEILEMIGKGGMGAVYRARHVFLEEERAIKVIQTRLAGDKGFIDRFIREARILTRLRHPNLVQLYEFGTLEEDLFFMVLEFLRGESVLARITARTRISVNESLQIIREAALGLHSAHQKGVVHRDISPDNLHVVKDEAGTEITKVIDFGIAKPSFEGTRHLTAASFFLGKPEYSSPEQCGVLQEGEVIDRRTDIYSLGVTLYYMIAGKLPFYSPTIQGYLLKHVNEIPRPPSSHLPEGEISPALDSLVLKCLAKKREERPQTMEELIAEIDKISGNENLSTSEFAFDAEVTSIEPGTLFARRYFIQKEIGEGGMGTVYKAIDKILDVPVALKVVKWNLLKNERTLERFKREVILARKVAHRNACRIFDIGESGGLHYVSMEYLEGRTLYEILTAHGPLPPEIGIPIIKQICEGLQEAHRVGVIHRDLKPQNIMVDSNDRAVIMDFGISISADADRLTQTGVMVGTPQYMAPEQFEGRNIDQRVDVYSIGVIMFEVFLGKLPFAGDSPVSIILAVMNNPPPMPTSIILDFPRDLETVMLKALEKDPQNRYQNVRELVRALQPFVEEPERTSAFPKEAIAHKYLAERNYSKAITYLKTLLKVDAENPKLRKLLDIAVSERMKRELRRVRSLIRKNNLIQAQLLIEKISRSNAENTRVINVVKKLETQLNKVRESTVNNYLQGAEELMAKRDWDAVMKHIESAYNVFPDDPRIASFQQKVIQKQKEQQTSSLQARQEEHLRSRVTKILEKTERRDFKLAMSLLQETRSEAVSGNIGTYATGLLLLIEKMVRALSSFSYGKIRKYIDQLIAQDVHGWLKSSEWILKRIGDAADADGARRQHFKNLFEQGKQFFDAARFQDAVPLWKEAAHIFPEDASIMPWIQSAEERQRIEGREGQQGQQKMEGAVLEIQQLYKEGKIIKALEKAEAVLKIQPEFHAVSLLRDQFRKELEQESIERQVKAAYDQGKRLYAQRQWEEAGKYWGWAVLHKPGDEKLRKEFEALNRKLTGEKRMRDLLTEQLKSCQSLIQAGNHEEVADRLKKMQESITVQYRLSDIENEILKLRRAAEAAMANPQSTNKPSSNI